jgi:hypothetical protein
MAYLGSLIAWIAGLVVLIKLFQHEGFLKGILGLICMLYTFVWGWMNIKRDATLKYWMYIWTALIVIGYIAQFLVASGE